MTCIHDKEINHTAEYILSHDILNPPKRTKTINSHYYPIIHGCMDTRKVKAKFKNFRILLYSKFSSSILMGRLIQRFHPKINVVMRWHTQPVNITTNFKVEIDSILPELSATNFVTWKYHVDESSKDRYDMILGRDILT